MPQGLDGGKPEAIVATILQPNERRWAGGPHGIAAAAFAHRRRRHRRLTCREFLRNGHGTVRSRAPQI